MLRTRQKSDYFKNKYFYLAPIITLLAPTPSFKGALGFGTTYGLRYTGMPIKYYYNQNYSTKFLAIEKGLK